MVWVCSPACWEWGCTEDGSGDIGHADAHADGGVGIWGRGSGERFGPLDLVEVTGGVVVDGGPEEVAEVLGARVREGRRAEVECLPDSWELLTGPLPENPGGNRL